MNILYSLQHLGFAIPPQADAGWIGEAGPGPSYLDAGSGGPDNDFTNRNATFMTWNLLHLARMLKDAGGFPAHGNQRSEWDAGLPLRLREPRAPLSTPGSPPTATVPHHDLDRRRARGRAERTAGAAHRRGRGRPRAAGGAAARVARPRPARAGAGAAGDGPADRGAVRGRPAPGAPRVGRARRGLPAPGRRLRRDVRRQHRGPPARHDPHAAADGDRAHLRHVDARREGRAHRGPVREAAQRGDRRGRPPLLPRRHGQRARAHRGGAAARRGPPGARVRERGRGDEPHARDHRRGPRRPPPPARVEHGLRPPVERRRALRARRHRDRPQPALHVRLRGRRQLAAHRRDVREPRDARARLRARDAASRRASGSSCSPPTSCGSATARASSTARTSRSPRCSPTRSA